MANVDRKRTFSQMKGDDPPKAPIARSAPGLITAPQLASNPVLGDPEKAKKIAQLQVMPYHA